MTGGVSPEKCWASYKYGIIKFWYIVASCWIFLYELYYDTWAHEHKVQENMKIYSQSVPAQHFRHCSDHHRHHHHADFTRTTLPISSLLTERAWRTSKWQKPHRLHPKSLNPQAETLPAIPQKQLTKWKLKCTSGTESVNTNRKTNDFTQMKRDPRASTVCLKSTPT
jgi:hypothetical protein